MCRRVFFLRPIITEHALGMSANFKQAERLKTRRGVVKELKETPKFHIAVLEFDE